MQTYVLTEITTKDKIIHQGIYRKPEKTSKKALLFVHGLTSTFYGNIHFYEYLIPELEKIGIGFAAFNNRGHDFIAGLRKVDNRKASGYSHAVMGSGFEIFTDSVYDIDAGISFLVSEGFSEIILVGSSTGANKVCYYAGFFDDKRVKGVVLVSPTSDRLVPTTDPKKRSMELDIMRSLIKQGKGDELITDHHYFPLTPKRYLSLFNPGSSEDVFDYGDENPKLTAFYKIKKPLLVVFGSRDESRDRPMSKIKKVFDTHTGSRNYKSLIIKGAMHNYAGNEEDLIYALLHWIHDLY